MTLGAFTDATLADLLSIQAEAHGDQPYLLNGRQALSYAEAEERSTRLAAGLAERGLVPGDRLAIILPNVPEFVLTVFAAAKAGLIMVPINVRRSRDEVLSRLSRTRPKAVVTFSEPQAWDGLDHLAQMLDLLPEASYLEWIISLQGSGPRVTRWDDLWHSTASPPSPVIRPQDAAAIVHTLGSSGEARGAVLTHTALVRNAAGVAETLRATSDDIFIGAVPFSSAFGLTPTILACTVAGATLSCLPRYDAGVALEMLETARISVHHGVPTMFALELNHPDFDPARCASLRTGIMAGAPCPSELANAVRHKMGMNLILAYGLTEASPSVSMTHLEDGPVTASQTVGRAMQGVELQVIDREGEVLPRGAEGELCVRGYNVMKGYWEDPQATLEVLDAEGWLHTGDLATIDADGLVRILGRKEEVIHRAGFKIHPGTVEMVLRSFPGVREAAVVGVPDAIYGEISCACVVRTAGSAISAEDLLAFAAERLADYAVPDRVLFFERLPRDGSGPVRKDYLRERVRIRGRAWTFGKNIDTDAIIPARHCNTSDPGELAKHCMEDADPTFVGKMKRGDLIVADTNFGCGSSREVAPISIKAAGVSAVIAKSFARIFFRNAINIGLPILECAAAVDDIGLGDEIEVEPAAGVIRNLTRGTTFQATPYPEFLQRIIERGGLLPYVEERLAERQT